MVDLIKTILLEIVSDKNALVVKEEKNDSVLNITINVAKDDMGKVIGKGGKVINAIRTIAKARATIDNVKVFVEIE